MFRAPNSSYVYLRSSNEYHINRRIVCLLSNSFLISLINYVVTSLMYSVMYQLSNKFTKRSVIGDTKVSSYVRDVSSRQSLPKYFFRFTRPRSFDPSLNLVYFTTLSLRVLRTSLLCSPLRVRYKSPVPSVELSRFGPFDPTSIYYLVELPFESTSLKEENGTPKDRRVILVNPTESFNSHEFGVGCHLFIYLTTHSDQ